MTTPTPLPSHPAVAEFLRLNELRTPGDWIADDFCEEDGEVRRLGTTDGGAHYYHRTATLAYFEIEDERGERPDVPFVSEPRRKFNCQFAASASKIAPEVRRLVEDMEDASTANHNARQLIAEQAAELTALRKERGDLREALILVLPLAKGYAAAHQVGSNAAYIQNADEALAHTENQETKGNGRENV